MPVANAHHMSPGTVQQTTTIRGRITGTVYFFPLLKSQKLKKKTKYFLNVETLKIYFPGQNLAQDIIQSTAKLSYPDFW